MKKEQKISYIKELIYEASTWKGYDAGKVKGFIQRSKKVISKVLSPDSKYVQEIDVFTNGKSTGIVYDYDSQIINILQEIKFEIESGNDDNIKYNGLNLHCNKCNHISIHNIIHEEIEREITPERTNAGLIDFWTDHHVQLLKCGSCSDFSLKKYSIWCDDAPDFPQLNITYLPRKNRSSIKLPELFLNVPANIIEIYKETLEALNNEIIILCAGGIRAILEAICIDKNIVGGNIPNEKYSKSLKGRIYGLCDAHYITNIHSQILIHHQYLGDKALHELEKPTLEELEIALDIVGHTLNSIYELEYKAKELLNRKENRVK